MAGAALRPSALREARLSRMSGPLATIPPDRGCDLAPRCLECPLPQCRYDGERERYGSGGRPSGPQFTTRMKAQEAARLRSEGYRIGQIAQQMGRHPRVIMRYLAIARDAPVRLPQR
jgi:hypothetical protein